MQFPNLGEHCNENSCKRLDFLPLKCSGCQKLFCSGHFHPSIHRCTASNQENIVPECPLCGAIIPIKIGESPDAKVGAHIDALCRSKPALELRGKIYTNSCSMLNCSKKEIVKFDCPKCFRNYCLRHRSEMDHNCDPSAARPISKSAAAAIFRAVFSQDQSLARKLQEDEDLKYAQMLNRQLNDRQNNSSRSYQNQNVQNSQENCNLQ